MSFDPRQVRDAICKFYPFLDKPAAAVADHAGLNKLTKVGTPPTLLPLRLQNIEAQALTSAMLALARRDPELGGPVLALPVHDSLIVPRSAAAYADELIRGAFGYHAKVNVRTTIDTAATP